MALAGYRIVEQLHSGVKSRVYRAIRAADGQPVIVKTIASAYPSPQQLDQLNHEHALLCRIVSPHVVQALGVEQDGVSRLLVLEDFAGQSLNTLLGGRQLDLALFLEYAIAITQGVQATHQSRVLHKDINPSNIVINQQTGQLKLIDFSIAAVLSREPQQPDDSELLAGTLAYISPEQTGRMNRVIDFRTDLYSLGITFYQMLAGHLPFAADDPLEMVHSQIAKAPPPLAAARPDLPAPIVRLVHTLLAKSADDRYQSAAGLLADLERSHQLLTSGQSIAFDLGQHDAFDQFALPSGLYGRAAGLAQLMTAFERASAGRAELLLVTGYSGVGKSRLVREVQRPIAERNGYFIAGKFDLLKRNVPLGCLYAAFRDLLRQILTESEERTAAWRARLLLAIGGVGQILIEPMPELALLIGPQPPAPELPPEQARNRFGLAFSRFVQVFCQPEHPLCLFLDDLQWADSATLQWLESQLVDGSSANLLIISPYRDNEVGPAHPLAMALARLQAARAAVQTLHLDPLGPADLAMLVADSLRTPAAECQDFTSVINAKTAGNPLFVTQCLLRLYEEGVIWFSPAERRWRYDIERAQQTQLGDNVIDLVSRRINNLSALAQHVLQVAACAGATVDLATLLVVAEAERAAVQAGLAEAVEEGFLVALGSRADDGQAHYRFLHDRVQQAALALSTPEAVIALRLQIARLLASNSADIEADEQLFDVADHFNAASALIAAPDERARLVRINLAASLRARQSAAFEIALEYIRQAMAFAEGAESHVPADLTLRLLLDRAECEQLCTHAAAAERFYDAALKLVPSPVEQALVYEKKIHFYANTARFKDAYEAGRAALLPFGMKLPASFVPPMLIADFLKIQLLMRNKPISAIADLPAMADPQRQMMVRIMAATAKAAYQIRPELCVLVAGRIVLMCLRHGNTSDGVIGYMALGEIFQGAILGRHRTGYEFGRVALQLLDRYHNTKHRAEVHFVTGYFATAWMRPVSEAEKLWAVAYQSGLETGDMFHAACACCATLQSQLMRGVPFDELWRDSERSVSFLQQINNHESLGAVLAVRQTVRNLRGATRSAESFDDEEFDEAAYVADLAGYGSRHFAHYYIVNKMQTLYLWQRYDQALALAQRSASYLKDSVGMVHSVEHHVYHALTLAALYAQARPRQQRAWRRALGKIAARLQAWSRQCPHNYRHKAFLVQAEIARISGDQATAVECYNTAIDAAIEYGYLAVQALANELAARFHMELGRTRIAQFHLQEAIYAYTRWGATAYAATLGARFPQLQADLPGSLHLEQAATLPLSNESSTNTSKSGALDLTTVIKSAEALVSSIYLPDLLRTLMVIMVENAGAQRGVLLLRRAGGLVIQAEHTLDAAAVELLEAVPLAAYAALPHSVINYVARTNEPLVLDDAVAEGNFTRDPYVVGQEPRSVLCQPLLNQGKLVGLLYVEHRRASGAFTAARLQVLNLLSAQAAIAIENAELYTTMEVSERKYRTLFEDSRDTIFLATLDGRLLELNPAGQRLLGYGPADLDTLSIQALCADPADGDRLQEALRQGSVKDFEIRLRARDQVEIDALLTATLRYAEDGTLAGYQGMLRDITARKRMEQERLRLSAIEHELSVAHEIQQSLLPPPRPAWPDLDALCYSMPAREVGGDFYSYHAFGTQGDGAAPPARYALAIGDITGKGVSAALLMATSLSQFDASLAIEMSAAERLIHLDRAIMPYTRPRRQNCALCYIELERHSDATATLTTINAGGIPPYIRSADGSVECLEIGGFALGQGLGMRLGYQSAQRTLGRGDLVILTSDGVVEANDAAGAMFGFEQLEAMIAAGPTASSAAMLEHMQRTLEAFIGPADLHDDLTIVVVQI